MCSKLWTGKVRNKETTSNLHLGMLDGIYNPRWLLSTGDEDAWHFVLDSRAARVNQRWGRPNALCMPDRGEAPLISSFGRTLAVRPPLDTARLRRRHLRHSPVLLSP